MVEMWSSPCNRERMTSMRNKREFGNRVIPFFGGKQPRLFEIERRCMDRDGKVIDFLDQHLPDGPVLDVGAGNGFTAIRLTTPKRTVVPLEPDENMIDLNIPLVWTRAVAQDMPFHNSAFHAAYSTWAFFFEGIDTIKDGLSELDRVTKSDGRIIIVDSAGDDEFCALSPKNIASNPDWWKSQGFQATIIETSFRFDSLEEANELLGFYFGDDFRKRNRKTEIEYKVVAYMSRAKLTY